jgi:ankyrin repeat protein
MSDVALLLIEKGANVNQACCTGATPLHEAVRHNLNVVVEKLLDKGASCAAQDLWGKTPLHFAAENNLEDDVVKLLVSKSSSEIHVQDEKKRTPLHLAVINKNTDVVKFLVSESSSEMRVQDHEQLTPVDHAIIQQSSNLLEYFLSVPDSGLVYSRHLYDRTLPSGYRRGRSINALYFAVENGLIRAVDHLVPEKDMNPQSVCGLPNFKFVDVNIPNCEGNTPLHMAVIKADPGMVKLLISKGADVFLTNKLTKNTYPFKDLLVQNYWLRDDQIMTRPEHEYQSTPLCLLRERYGRAADFSADLKEIEFYLLAAEFAEFPFYDDLYPIEYVRVRPSHMLWAKDLLARILANPEEYPDTTYDRFACMGIAQHFPKDHMIEDFEDLIRKETRFSSARRSLDH